MMSHFCVQVRCLSLLVLAERTDKRWTARCSFLLQVKKEDEKLELTCDAVIVGSGAGGGTAAGVLAKAGLKVHIF